MDDQEQSYLAGGKESEAFGSEGQARPTLRASVPYWSCCGSLDPMHADARAQGCMQAKWGNPERCRFGTREDHAAPTDAALMEAEARSAILRWGYGRFADKLAAVAHDSAGGLWCSGVPPELDEVLQFLYGAEQMEGKWFGDLPPEGKAGRYWWRSILRAAIKSAFGPCVSQKAESDPQAGLSPTSEPQPLPDSDARVGFWLALRERDGLQKPIEAHSKSQFKRLDALGANVVPPNSDERERCARICETFAQMVDDGAGAVGRLWQVARKIRAGDAVPHWYDPERKEPIESLAPVAAQLVCNKCGGAMRLGKAMGQTVDCSDEGTCSPAGPGVLIDCMKCSACGWSVTGSGANDKGPTD